MYATFDDLAQKNSKVGDLLPYTINAGTKRYIGFENEFVVERDGLNISHCNNQSECMQILCESLNKDYCDFENNMPSLHCPELAVSTRVEFSGYASLITRQEKGLITFVGCEVVLPAIPNDILPLPTAPNEH
jgi:hypothetical protein